MVNAVFCLGKGDVKVFWSLFDMAKVKGELLTAGLQSIWSSIWGKDTVTVAARPQGQLVPLFRACLIRSI